MKAIKKITSVFLAIAFLLSSLGFTVNKMVCLKSGKTKISLTHAKNCCPEKKSSIPVLKSNCCDLTNSTFSLADFSASQKCNAPHAELCLLPLVQKDFIQITYSDSKSKIVFANLPPPLSGRELLSFLSILNI